MSSPKCNESLNVHGFMKAANHILLYSCMLATVYNILVAFCAWRIFSRNNVYTHVLIIMMSLSDALLTGYSYPMVSLQYIRPSLQFMGVCASVQITVWLGQALSSLFLTAINIDRLVFFHYPLKYILLTKKYAIAICVFVVASSFSSVGALWLSKSAFITHTCATAFTQAGIYAYLAFIAATCALPIVSSFGLSSYLFVLTSRRRALSPSNAKCASKRKVNSLLFIFTTSLWTLISLLPSRLFMTWYFLMYTHRSNCPDGVVFWLACVSNWLMRIYPMLNPLITGFVSAPYRRELTRIFIEIKFVVLRVRRS